MKADVGNVFRKMALGDVLNRSAQDRTYRQRHFGGSADARPWFLYRCMRRSLDNEEPPSLPHLALKRAAGLAVAEKGKLRTFRRKYTAR